MEKWSIKWNSAAEVAEWSALATKPPMSLNCGNGVVSFCLKRYLAVVTPFSYNWYPVRQDQEYVRHDQVPRGYDKELRLNFTKRLPRVPLAASLRTGRIAESLRRINRIITKEGMRITQGYNYCFNDQSQSATRLVGGALFVNIIFSISPRSIKKRSKRKISTKLQDVQGESTKRSRPSFPD